MTPRGRRHAGRVLRRAGHALEAPLRRLDRLGAEPGDEAAVADAAEGEPARADVERADRVPAVPLRPGRRVEQGGLVSYTSQRAGAPGPADGAPRSGARR
ncbi:MAG: hypothetical protein MZW92_04455 [Comamonadaceae bacterium]|nr:hypothetical protein [Comamonadaceae bacterium]